MTIAPDLLERALARLTPDEALAVSAALEPKASVRSRRLNLRDELIRQALADAVGATPTARACTLQRRLTRATRGHGRGDELAHRILQLSEGRGLDWTSLARIGRAGRNPVLCKNGDGAAQTGWAASSDDVA